MKITEIGKQTFRHSREAEKTPTPKSKKIFLDKVKSGMVQAYPLDTPIPILKNAKHKF